MAGEAKTVKKKMIKGRHVSAIKRNRQNKKLRESNKGKMSCMRTAIKKVRIAATAKDKKTAQVALLAAISTIDKTASKGVIPKTRASRYKSRLSLLVNKI